MLEDANPPRRARGQNLVEVAREDLEPYAVEELSDRIDQLQAEIARTQAQIDKKQLGRSAADALFKR